MCDSNLTPHFLEAMGRIALDTTRDSGVIPEFRLLCQVAHTVVSAIACSRRVRHRNLKNCNSSGGYSSSSCSNELTISI
ncbi:hypothetical protein, partial [Nostoc sp. 2RC]|uniref:hypothetical protein n=1 Tax=Nostoc sp. 2RC TaxID=2485484 RepID=UPI001C8A6F15